MEYSQYYFGNSNFEMHRCDIHDDEDKVRNKSGRDGVTKRNRKSFSSARCNFHGVIVLK